MKNSSVLSRRPFFRNYHHIKQNSLKDNSVVNKRQIHRNDSISESTAPKYFRTAAMTTAVSIKLLFAIENLVISVDQVCTKFFG